MQDPSFSDARDPSVGTLRADALTTADLGVWQWNPKTHEETSDSGLQAILKSCGEGVARNEQTVLTSRLSMQDRKRLQQAALRSAREKQPFDLIFDFGKVGDGYRKIRIRGGISAHNHQAIIAVCHLVWEPTDHDRSSVALPNGIAYIGTDGRICYVNQTLLRMWRFEHEDEMLGLHVTELLRHRDQSAVVFELLFQVDEWNSELIGVRLDGTQFDAVVNATLIRDQRGKPSYWIGSFTDVGNWCKEQLNRLEASEAMLAEAQRIAKVGNWELDCLQNQLIWSDELFRIYEVDRRSWRVSVKTFLGLLSPDDRTALVKVYEESLSNQRPYEFTHRACMPDGRIKWIQENWASDFDADGRPLRSIGTAQDVTRQKEAEIALRVAHKRLLDILDSLYGFVGLCEIDGTLIEANRAPLEAAGLSREEVIGRPFWECYWWSYSDTVQSRLRDALRRAALGEIVRFEIPVRVRDDSLIMIDVMFGPLREVDGKINKILGFAVDITERKRLENLLRQSEKSIRTTLDAIPAQIAVLDDCGVIIMTNQAWKDFATRGGLDWRKVSDGVNYLLVCEQAIGTGSEQAKQVAAGIREVIAGRKKEFLVKFDCSTSEERRWFLCHVKRYFDGVRECVIVVHADITAVEKAEMQLEEVRSQLAHAGRVSTLGEMAAGIAHELNQPLAAISLYAEGCLHSMKQDSLPTDLLQHKLHEITELAGRCGKIIRGLRDCATRQTKAMSTIDVCEVIRASMAIVEHECGRAGIPCRIELSDDSLWINGNAVQIQQVIFNLVRNAIEAQQDCAPESCQIVISARRSGDDYIRIAVSDNGDGIAANMTSRLFEPFFTTKKSGMGMGLKISQTIVEAHSGSITFKAETGGGTTFMVNLPTTKEQCE